MALFMSVNGRTRLDMDSDFACFQINLTISASGVMANQRGRESWYTKIRQCFQGNGWPINSMVEDFVQKLMVQVTKGIGLNIYSMVKELKNGRIILSTEEILSKDSKKARGS